MASTIDQGFRQLRSSLEISDLQAGTVSTRQQNVRAAIEEALTVLDSFLTGSYMRSTMISPLKEADVDIFVVLDPSYYTADGYAALLDRVKRALLGAYKTPKISRNGHAVTITFSDFLVDVVPGFQRQGGGYLIPDPARKMWISTDPKKHVTLWAETNAAHAGDFVPLVKMLKAWNKTHSALLNSFHLETLARHILTNVTITDFPSGVRFFFDKARSAIDYTLPDPAGLPGLVGEMSTVDRAGAKSRIETGYSRAVVAENLGNQGQTAAAFDKWQQLFPGYFPAYG
jgi:hypothetical protein